MTDLSPWTKPHLSRMISILLVAALVVCTTANEPFSPTEWEEIVSYTGVTDISTVLALVEIHQGELRMDCGVRSDVLERLHSHAETNTQLIFDIWRYVLARKICDEDPDLIGTPIHDLVTASPRLPVKDPCFSVLGDELLEMEGKKNWKYKLCSALYLSRFME